MMGSRQFARTGELHTQACKMEIMVLKSAPMEIIVLWVVLATTGLLVKKPYFIPMFLFISLLLPMNLAFYMLLCLCSDKNHF